MTFCPNEHMSCLMTLDHLATVPLNANSFALAFLIPEFLPVIITTSLSSLVCPKYFLGRTKGSNLEIFLDISMY